MKTVLFSYNIIIVIIIKKIIVTFNVINISYVKSLPLYLSTILIKVFGLVDNAFKSFRIKLVDCIYDKGWYSSGIILKTLIKKS